ncbi:MAG TPA: threonine/serine exporter family protein, partial [Mycobacterium sp.]|nr:threonine/serine exporter family protein [Mycobacterium sp.]
MPSERDDVAAPQFVAALGAAMAAANYPVTLVRNVMQQTARAYGLDHEFLALPNYVQVGSASGEGIYIANPDFNVRYDQSFPLAKLVARAPSGTVSPEEGMAELERIRNLDKRFPLWITVLGYAVQSIGLALILQPTPWSLYGAATLGLLVGGLTVIGRRNEAIGYMLPTVCAFLVAFIVFKFDSRWHVGTDSLRALAAPLATFLPGAGITLAVIELATNHVVSGASRLVAGFMQIAQLAFGILIAAQLAGIADASLDATQLNRLGPWAPFVGVLVYGLGIWLNFAPPTKFLPWMVLMLYVAYAGQWIGNAVLGSYASGFGGGLTLILFALAISHRPNTPPTMSLVVPGFWLLVPGSLGFMGITQLLGTHSTAVFTATLISMMSIAVGVQTGLLLW